MYYVSGSRAYKFFFAVVKNPYLLRDLGKFSPIHQTFWLEVYHNIVITFLVVFFPEYIKNIQEIEISRRRAHVEYKLAKS